MPPIASPPAGTKPPLLGQWVGVYRHPVEPYLCLRAVPLPRGRPLHLVQRVESVDHVAKDGVLAVEVRVRLVRDEELGGGREGEGAKRGFPKKNLLHRP